MKTKTALIMIPLLGLLLGGCTLYPNFAPQPSPTPVVQSSGDAETDLKEIDKAMQQDEDTDAAGVTAKDLGL